MITGARLAWRLLWTRKREDRTALVENVSDVPTLYWAAAWTALLTAVLITILVAILP